MFCLGVEKRGRPALKHKIPPHKPALIKGKTHQSAIAALAIRLSINSLYLFGPAAPGGGNYLYPGLPRKSPEKQLVKGKL
ncbi:MAG: hypothetical protein DU429_06120 [Candidatus Tokpelaia sp.]|nr:MAG: hypothetical protein DU429_06120 [Candidatus Tokpelaia sp.]KAA6206563.1 MAG: hypothetical protein DU430_00280 [Candidatus Tokpelaia sp.]